MIIVVSALLLAMATIAIAPDLPISRKFRSWLVDRPVRWLADASPAKIALKLSSFLLLIVLAVAAPELVMLSGALADAAMVEVLLAVWLAATFGGLRGAWRRVLHLASRAASLMRRTTLALRRARPRTRRKPAERQPPDHDDASRPPFGAGLALA